MIIGFLIYAGIELGVGLLFIKLINIGILSEGFLKYMLYISYLLIFIIQIIFLFSYRKKCNVAINKKISGFIVLVPIFACLFRIISDPILRIGVILGNVSIPVNPSTTGMHQDIQVMIIIMILGPIAEELQFRKISLDFFNRKNKLYGVILTSLIFSANHISNFQYIDIIMLFEKFCIGIVLSLLYIKYGLIYSVLFHIFSNLIWYFLHLHEDAYWKFIKVLDFGFWYWVIIIMSFILFFYILFLTPRSRARLHVW